MDTKHFDQLARSLSHTSARRGAFHYLAALPLAGGIAALFGEDEAGAKGGRTKAHHERQLGAERKRKKKKRKKKCKPQSLTTTCDGKCGPVTNNCKKTVDCGGCESGSVCLAGTCQFCGLDGELCCAGDTCEAGAECHEGTCQFCGFPGEPCCAGDTCQSDDVVCLEGTCASCGSLGEPCCADNTCIEGTCAAGQCQP